MKLFLRPSKPARLLVSLACLLAASPASRAQTQPTRPPQDEDVVRVESGLVQTDVTVVDKQGRHVDGLKAEQFELKVDGKPQPLSFFERVVAGSSSEQAQLASAARGSKPDGTTANGTPATTAAAADSRGRIVYLFLDNLHLDPESFIRARQLLLRAIDNELAPGDRAAVVASGSGFVTSQLTSDKAELKAAVNRVGQREGAHRDGSRPPMNEYQALLIKRGDRQTLEFFVEQILKESPEFGREGAVELAKTRAENIVEQSAPLAANTFIALENLVRSAAQSPGRKLVLFVSGGFMLEGDRANSFENLRRVADMAAREGVLVYTLNARGLVTGFADASEGGSARLTGSNTLGEMAVQDVLYSLAAETGGRALVNSNDLDAGVRRALQETAVYYLLAWQPPKEALASGRFKSIEVSIAGRPDLRVLTRRNLAAVVSASLARGTASPAAASPAQEFLGLLANSATPRQDIPAALVLAYRDAPSGPPGFVLTTSVQVQGSALPAPANNATAVLDFAAVVLDAQGKRVHGSAARVPYSAATSDKQLFHNFTADLAPGRYQVRAGARDAASGRVGSAAQWVEIPDLSGGKFSLSSLMLTEQADVGEAPGAPKGVARRFAQTSRLRFLAYTYNAAPDPANDNTPDLDLKVQVLRNGQPVQVPPLIEVLVEGEDESKRFPVAAEIPLDDFAAGEYTLQVTVTDRLKKTTATQQAAFVVVE